MKKQTFNCVDQEMILVSEDIFSPTNQLLQTTDCTTRPPIITTHRYNEKGGLLESKDMEGNRELNKTTYTYNEEGKVTSIDTSIGGDPYECTATVYSEDGHIETMTQDGEEMVRKTYQNTNFGYIETTYSEGEFIECNHYHLNEAKEPTRIELYEEDGELIDTIIYSYNESGALIGKKFYEDEVLYAETTYELGENDLVNRVVHLNHEVDTPDEYLVIYTYDDHKNIIKEEEIVDGVARKVLHWKYDDQNRNTERQGLTARVLDAFGNLESPERFFHLVYKYID